MAAFSTIPSPVLLPLSSHRPDRALASRFLSPTPLFRQSKRLPLLRSSTAPRFAPVVAVQSNLLKVIQTTWRVGKDVIEAGTKIVPEIVPKPIARILVVGVAVTVALFLLKSVLSTAFFVLAMMGAIYFIFIAFNTNEGPKGSGGSSGVGGSTSTEEEALEEARRIMEKYK